MVASLPLLQELLAIASLSGQAAEASAFLVAQMNSLGYRAQVGEAGNAVGIIEQPDAQGQITREGVLLGHIDTVPGDIPVRVEEGCLYGRGSVDAKGPLATFVMAGAQTRLPPGTRLIVVGAVEEEAATSKGARHIANCYRPDYCIIGEPSNWDAITLGYKGSIVFDYHFSQPTSHSAGPDKAVAEYAVSWWNAIHAYAASFNESRERVFDRLSPSLRQIETRSDGLNDSVFAQVGVRIPPDFDLNEVEAVIRRFAGEASLKVNGAVPAHQAERHTVLVRTFSAVLREHEVRLRFKVKTGTSDMNIVGPAWDCPIVAYGRGDSHLDHTPNEHLVIDEYRCAITILTQVLEQL